MRIPRNDKKIIEADLSYKFENELKKENINYTREQPIILENRKSNFVDFIIEDKILIDIKAKPFIEKDDYYQMKRYLEVSNIKLGLIINFRQKYLQPKRVLNPKYNSQHSNAFVVSHRVNGFTLIELLLAMTIVALVAVFGLMNLSSYRARSDLNHAGQEIVIFLRNAQSRSQSQESGSRWGVHFENPSGGDDFYELFWGGAYSTSAVASRANLSSRVQFNAPATGSSSTVIFSPTTGLPTSSTTIKIFLVGNPSVSSTITVDKNGRISF